MFNNLYLSIQIFPGSERGFLKTRENRARRDIETDRQVFVRVTISRRAERERERDISLRLDRVWTFRFFE